MHAAFVKEQKRYTQKELCEIFSCTEDTAVSIIRKLKGFGILKAVKAVEKQRDMSELCEDDMEVSDAEIGGNEVFHVFTFVGIVVVSGIVLKCCPKYLLKAESPSREMAQILKVLEKYHAEEQMIYMFHDSGENAPFRLLPVLLFFMRDYYENGIYHSTSDVIEHNGSGEIIWDRTINETFAHISRRRPYYTDLRTKKRVADANSYFRRLHKCILTSVSRELEEAGLLDLFELPAAELTEETLDDLGDKAFILYRIENELNVQFNTRKQLLLKTFYTYIDQCGSLCDADCMTLWGTSSFHLVWETVCAKIMDDRLGARLDSLNLPVPLSESYCKSAKLIDIIDRPLWTITGQKALDTLIPDIVTTAEVFGSWQFLIFDAKYYTARLDAGCIPKGQPGIESVAKQYLYQLAFQKFIEAHHFSSVRNCFLLPTEDSVVADKGEVSLQMLEAFGLVPIKVRLLPASMAFDHYLSGRKFDISLLNL